MTTAPFCHRPPGKYCDVWPGKQVNAKILRQFCQPVSHRCILPISAKMSARIAVLRQLIQRAVLFLDEAEKEFETMRANRLEEKS